MVSERLKALSAALPSEGEYFLINIARVTLSGNTSGFYNYSLRAPITGRLAIDSECKVELGKKLKNVGRPSK